MSGTVRPRRQAPANHRHRFLRSKAQLRADMAVLERDCERLEAVVSELACKIVIASGEVDEARRERDTLRAAMHAAARRIAELEEAARQRALAARPAPDAADLAISRALDDTRELRAPGGPADAAEAPMVNTTRHAWKAPTPPAPPTPARSEGRPAPRLAVGPTALPVARAQAARTFTVVFAPGLS